MERIDFVWTRGDDERETLLFETEDDLPVDFTGVRFDLHIVPERGGRRIRLDSDGNGITFEGNRVVIDLAHDLTDGAAWQAGLWDLQVTDATGRVKTLCGGRVRLLADVTREV